MRRRLESHLPPPRYSLKGISTSYRCQAVLRLAKDQCFLVCECKDWATRPIDEQPIIRLCLLAYIGGAMPVLCHTTHLTTRAWKLAQAFDVRLLTQEDLRKDQLPPLTSNRPPRGTCDHRQEYIPLSFRSSLPLILCRHANDDHPDCLSGPVFEGSQDPPCYVQDRSGHDEYVSARRSDYDFE